MIKLVVVTGSGRSGTSSVAGTLKRLGFHIPQPEVEADERNPRGYYEPQWVASFHKRFLNKVPVRTIDTRPDAGEIAMAAVSEKREENLRTWLAEEIGARSDGDVVVVKETRAYWIYPLWQRVAGDVGATITSLTMLRHPTQVVRSRDAAYLVNQSDELRLQRETTNVAGWINSVLETERTTRGNPRAFVSYVDLVGDWRSAMTRACAQLDIDPGDLSAPHDVDDFVTSSLNHSSDVWDGLTVAPALIDLAERTWVAAHVLVAEPHDEQAMAELDRLRGDYLEMYTTSMALAADDVAAQVLVTEQACERKIVRRDAKSEKVVTTLKERLTLRNERITKLRGELEELRTELREHTGGTA